MDDVIRHAQLLRRDEDELHAIAAGQALDEGMDGAAELQVTAEADGQMIQPSLAAADGQHVQQRLGGMAVTAVAGIDHRNTGNTGRRAGERPPWDGAWRQCRQSS